MDRIRLKIIRRRRRKMRVRKKVFGTPDRPRLSVFRSLKHIYCQLIDDLNGKTLVGVSSLSKDVKDKSAGKTKTEIAKITGEILGKKALDLGIKKAVFDRNGYKYHGRVKALADGAREVGLEF